MGIANIFDEEQAMHYLRTLGIFDFVSDVDIDKNPVETNGKNPIHIKATMDSVSDEKLQEIISKIISRKDYHIEKLSDGKYKLELVNKKYAFTLQFEAPSDLVKKIKNTEGVNFKNNLLNNGNRELLNAAVYKYVLLATNNNAPPAYQIK